jgi:hypothetical protein
VVQYWKKKGTKEMSAIVLDGKALVRGIEAELVIRVQRIKEKSNGKPPILGTILVVWVISSFLLWLKNARPLRLCRVAWDR